MPNAHFDVSIISRSGGHRGGRLVVASAAYRSGSKVAALAAAGMMMATSVVASAAYRSGETLYDSQADKIFDYTRKEDVLYSEIMTPEYAPVWASDRQNLWNQVEAIEKRKDAQLARDIIAALPRELDAPQQIALVREFVQTQFVDHGMIADVNMHDKRAGDGGNQPHVHITLTMRDISKDGFGKKNREWNQRTLVSAWRDAWAETTNRHLEAAGRSERLSLRSYAEQGIDKVPGEHMGAQAWNMEQKGRETGKGDVNREIEHANIVNELVKIYDRAAPSHVTGSMLDAIHQEQGRLDARLMASVRAEEAGANDTESESSGAFRHADSDTALTGSALSDQQLEAMHWASVRQAVRGLVQQSVQAVAERLDRLRFYGQAVLDKTQEMARSVVDRAGSALASRARQEAMRRRASAHEEPER